ncbi:MAG: recombinase family protein [Polyangiales bacterium]
MSRALAYVRVSSDGQADNTSLDAQAESVAVYTTSRGWTLDETFSDVALGATLDRPGLSVLHLDDAVTVYMLDRLSRSIVDTEPLISEWESRGVALHSVTEPLDTSSAMARATLRMVRVFAQAEREEIA